VIEVQAHQINLSIRDGKTILSLISVDGEHVHYAALSSHEVACLIAALQGWEERKEKEVTTSNLEKEFDATYSLLKAVKCFDIKREKGGQLLFISSETIDEIGSNQSMIEIISLGWWTKASYESGKGDLEVVDSCNTWTLTNANYSFLSNLIPALNEALSKKVEVQLFPVETVEGIRRIILMVGEETLNLPGWQKKPSLYYLDDPTQKVKQ